jgi:hypothetical protein
VKRSDLERYVDDEDVVIQGKERHSPTFASEIKIGLGTYFSISQDRSTIPELRFLFLDLT